MMWNAGQARLEREEINRLREMHVAVRDGYLAAEQAVRRVTLRGRGPAYMESERPRDPAANRSTLLRLADMFPGAIEGIN